MRKIYAHWCYTDNCGDALNPYILEKLSGCKVVFCNYKTPNYITEFKNIIKCLLSRKRIDYNRLVPPFLRRKKDVILAIGSILDRSLPNFKIWGAGYMNEFEHADGGTLYAVRGYYSAIKLQKEGFPLCKTYGDPALLLPLVYKPHVKKIYKYGIIPHLKEYSKIKDCYPKENIINLNNTNVEIVINNILKCEYIISSSLHGIIIAHAYGIPAIWIKLGDINTDGIKFKDYFSSVNIPIYNGNYTIDEFINTSYIEIDPIIKKCMLPRIPILDIQRALIKVCPFEILPKIKETINLNMDNI